MIPQITELNFPAYATLSTATVTLADMSENTITAEVRIDGSIIPDFSYDWEVMFRGEKYVHSLRKPGASKDNTSVNSVCSLTFKHKAVVELQRYYFFTYASTNSGTAVADQYIAPLTLNLKNFCIAFNEVLDYYFHGSITIDLNPDWVYDPEPKTINISYSYLWDVLIQLYELYGVRWRIVTVDGKYVIKVGYGTEELNHIFQYGFEGGLLKVERQVQDDNIRNILLGRGGEKNLPAYYFKDNTTDTTFPSDPDWIPELSNVYFDSLRDSNFRDYVKGWKTNPNRDLMDGKLELEAYDADYAADHFAYELGATDEFFRPVEYVKDEDSIAQYGELWGALENNEDIYPTIQGVTIDPIGRVDEVIAVQPIESDDVEQSVSSEAQLSNLPEVSMSVSIGTGANNRSLFNIQGGIFTVEEGLHGVLEVTPQVKSVRVGGKWYSGDEVAGRALVQIFQVNVYSATTNATVPPTNIPPGTYYYMVGGMVLNTTSEAMTATIGISNGNLVTSDASQKWGNTFDIWIKNIWQTEKQTGETDQHYVNRVWTPILGGRDGEEAKIVFSTGWLSTSEDYEFTIVKGGVHFEQKECTWTDSEGNEHTYTSEWRLTLAKSDAELDATGLYLPNTRINASAGDFFFFIGIELPHQYILWAEERLNAYKRDQLGEVADIQPTWVVELDKIRISQYGEGQVESLIEQIQPGASFKLADPRFITDRSYENLYVQSMTFDFKEPTDNDPALIPDLSIVLSDKWQNTASVVGTLQGSIDALTKQIGSISNIEQIVRMIGDRLYLRKDGFSDLSLSPTQFASLVTSLGFRQGLLGGQGWGFFKDEQDNWSLEVDRLNVRQQMEVNSLVINQISARGGMYVESAASMEITDVILLRSSDGTPYGYSCYFDQKNGTVANLFQEGDIALCHRYTPENGELKFYKRRVLSANIDNVLLSATIANGDGIPAKGDVIVQYGSYTKPSRRYVKVRDVIGGGYERYIEGLDSVTATGTEYYFVGRQSGSYGNNPRFFIGNTDNFIEFINGVLNIKAKLNIKSPLSDGRTLEQALDEAVADTYSIKLTNELAGVACDADGNVIGELPSTEIMIYRGANMDDKGWNISNVDSGCTSQLSGTTLTITSITDDTASVTIYASKADQSELVATMNIYKVKPGVDGEPAVVYSLELSANTISRSAIGNLSASTITVQKYKTTGASERELTTEKTIRYQRIGVDEDWQTPARFDYTIVNIPVPENEELTAIVVELVDGTAVLDRERIPVITDGTEITQNLVRDSELNLVTNAYMMKKIQCSPLLEYGQQYTFTIWGTPAAGKSFQIWDNLGGTRICTLSQIADGIYSATAKIPNGINLQYLNIYAAPSSNTSSSTIEKVKIEEGLNRAPVWTESPEDFSYIKRALQENTSIEGGLILTSLIRLGYTQQNGQYVVKSGINGIVNTESAPAVWAGGEMIDRASSTAANAAKAMIRHDGTAYFADNTVRFGESVMQVGENVQLDDSGLSLNIGDNMALHIGDVSVGDLMTAASSVYNIPAGFAVPAMLYKDLTGEYYPTGTGTAVRVNSTQIAEGAILRLKGSISWPIPTIGNWNATTICLDVILNGKLAQTYYFMLMADESDLKYSFDLPPYKLPEAGYVDLRLRFPYQIESTWEFVEGNPFGSASATMDTSASSLSYSTGNQTTIGRDGFLSVWGQALLLCRDNEVQMKCSGYGLRITTAGIQKLVNGNWQTANI